MNVFAATSVSHRSLSTRLARTFLGFACVAALASASAPLALAASNDSYDQQSGGTGFVSQADGTTFAVCGAQTIHARIDTELGTVEFGITDSTGGLVYGEATTLEVGFASLSRVRLRVQMVDAEGVLELSPDGKGTELYTTSRGRTNIFLDEDPSAPAGHQWIQDYLLVALDPGGQELPAVPKITVKTKKNCPAAPILPGS